MIKAEFKFVDEDDLVTVEFDSPEKLVAYSKRDEVEWYFVPEKYDSQELDDAIERLCPCGNDGEC